MPFFDFRARSFTESAIRSLAPAASGVYGLSNSRRWLYIGATGNIQEALLEHFRHPEDSLLKQRPTGFTFEACDSESRNARHDVLVIEYNPMRRSRGVHR